MSKVVKEFKSLAAIQAPVPPKSRVLPVVSGNTIDAIYHVYGGQRWGEHLTGYKDRLIHENPHLVKFIESQISKFPPNIHTAMFEIVIGTLTVLEHQGLVNAKRQKRRKLRSKPDR
jgi:hypothetical protein